MRVVVPDAWILRLRAGRGKSNLDEHSAAAARYIQRSIMAGIKIRALTKADLQFADLLRALAGWNQTLADWTGLVEHDPQGCFVAEWNGQPAGTVTTTTYSAQLAWIGMLLVHPDFRRRGLGRALLERGIEHLHTAGVQCIKLDATPQGLPLYEQIGFRREWTLRRWQRTGMPSVKATVVREATRDDFARIAKLDAESFGVSRCRLLGGILDSASRVLVNEEAGAIKAFGVTREGAHASYLGPVLALSVEDGRNIAGALMSCLPRSRPAFWDIPDPNVAAIGQACDFGFAVQRELTRMYLGETVSCRVEQMFGIAGPEVG